MKTVTLTNGIILEVGKKYKCDDYTHVEFVEIKVLGDRLLIGTRQLKGFLGTSEEGFVIDSNWLPYTAPQEEVKWKTFLIEFEGDEDYSDSQLIVRFKSEEEAMVNYPSAKKITEVEIDIKEK